MEDRILTIARMGHPILKTIAQPVTDLHHPSIQQLIKDMKATVAYLNCTGLAAPQVFSSLRIVLFRVMNKTNNPRYQLTPEYDPDGVPWTLMINPIITPLTEEKKTGLESCLSLPDLAGMVPRYHSIHYKFMDENGQNIERVAHGFHARVVQHECDHLDGILYPNRMEDITSLSFMSEISR